MGSLKPLHGLLMVIAMGVAVWLTSNFARRKSFSINTIYALAPWTILGGILAPV